MGRMRKAFAGLMILSMMTQPMTAFAKLNFNNVGVVDKQTNPNKVWYTIPTKQAGENVECFTQKVDKTYIKSEGHKVTENGSVSIWVKSYAYIEGTDESVKVGATLTYLNAETNDYVTEWWESKETYSKEEIGWPNVKELHIELAEDLKFIEGDTKNQKMNITLKTNKDASVTLQTKYPVAFEEKGTNPSERDSITFTAMDEGVRELDEYVSKLDPTAPFGNSKIFNPPLEISPNSFVELTLNLQTKKDGEAPKYQIVSGDTEPQLPYTGGTWKPIRTELSENGTRVQYTDMIDTPNLLTVQHYIYTPGYFKSPEEYGYSTPRDRAVVFSSPVNKPVQQSTVLGTNQTYSTQALKPAFFKRSTIKFKTTLNAVFVPKETGEYKFTVRSATGSKGVITVDGKEIIFADNFDTHIEKDDRYYGLNTSVKLEAGKRYTMYMETHHESAHDKAPCFMYSMKPQTGWPEDYYVDEETGYNEKYADTWKIVTPELLQEQDPSNGANRAMKLWGFIVPDKSGKFNFGLQADDGAYGYLLMDGKEKVFVDSFKITETTDQSNNEVFEIKKGVAYPFYLEWYEGCPNEQSLAPRYRVAKPNNAEGEGWMDIPSHWFRPSSNLEVAENPLSTYYGIEAKERIELPYNNHMNYIILEAEDINGEKHQIKYGPFTAIQSNKVEPEKPQMATDKNYVVPTSVSNVNSTVLYNVDSKAISYEVDLTDLKTKKLNGSTLFKSGLDVSQMSVVVQEGTVNENGRLEGLTKLKADEYTLSVSGEKINITLKDPEKIMKKGTGHQLDIYLRIDLNNDISYYDKENKKWYYTTYKTNKVDAEGKEIPDAVVKVTSKKKHKIADEVYSLTTNTLIKPATYSTNVFSTISKVGLDLRQIPGIN